jgi:hypothetical protein
LLLAPGAPKGLLMFFRMACLRDMFFNFLDFLPQLLDAFSHRAEELELSIRIGYVIHPTLRIAIRGPNC